MWHPGLIVVLAAVGVLYFLVIGRWRNSFSGSSPVANRNKFYFVAGLVLYYAVEGSPWKVIGHYLFSAHMVTMTIAYLSVPPLILLGIPRWFWKPVLHKPVLVKTLKFLTMPIFIIVLFNMLFSFDHIPMIFNTVMESPILMPVVHYILLITAFLMWWPVITPIPEIQELSSLQKVIYMFANGMLLTPACALLFLSGHLVFEPYFHVPRLVSFMSPLDDQQSAGVFMKAIQELTYGIAICCLLYKWATTERKKDESSDPYATSAMSQTLRRFEPNKSEN
jgi:putative membrane protein